MSEDAKETEDKETPDSEDSSRTGSAKETTVERNNEVINVSNIMTEKEMSLNFESKDKHSEITS